MLPERIYFFEAEHVIEAHDVQLKENGGGKTGLSKEGLGALESAVGMASAGYGGFYFHPTLFSMAAAYMYHIANGHCFLDGNKRTALVVALEFLAFHGILVQADETAFLRLMFRTVSNGAFTAADLPPGILPEEVNIVQAPNAMKKEIAEFFEKNTIASIS